MIQIEKGQKWIETRMYDIAKQFGLKIVTIEWCGNEDGTQKHKTTLAFMVENLRYTIKLDNADIQGSVVAAGIQENIDQTIKHILRTIKDKLA